MTYTIIDHTDNTFVGTATSAKKAFEIAKAYMWHKHERKCTGTLTALEVATRKGGQYDVTCRHTKVTIYHERANENPWAS